MLPEYDKSFLDESGYRYELKEANNEKLVIIYDFPIHPCYQPNLTNLIIKIVPGYPDAPLDMFWVKPYLKLSSGPDPVNTNIEQVAGEDYQRFSRHLSNTWRPGIDGLEQYVRCIKTDLARGR